MQIQFTGAARRWLFFLGVFLIAAVIAIFALKNGVAETDALSTEPEKWLRAAQLEPGNADNWYRLGRYRQLDFEHSDLPLAISYFRRAVAIDPGTAIYWLDLSGAEEMQGDMVEARRTLEKALSVYPASAEVAWRYGNFLLRQGEMGPAYAQIHRAVAADSKLAALAISRCWRSDHDIERILNEALPATSSVYWPALRFLVSEGELDAALSVWKRLQALHPNDPLSWSFALLDPLIERGRIDDAVAVWKQALALAGLRELYSSPSLVWDGGFESDFTDGGFGWQHKNAEGFIIDFDTETRRSGARSLRVSFDGSQNIAFVNAWQLVAVQPNTHYRFAGYLRTQDISTDTGMHLAITFSRNPEQSYLLTPNETGSKPWTLEELDFTTGPQTRVIHVMLARQPSLKFDNKLRGTVWVDDVSLVPLAQEPWRSPR